MRDRRGLGRLHLSVEQVRDFLVFLRGDQRANRSQELRAVRDLLGKFGCALLAGFEVENVRVAGGFGGVLNLLFADSQVFLDRRDVIAGRGKFRVEFVFSLHRVGIARLFLAVAFAATNRHGLLIGGVPIEIDVVIHAVLLFLRFAFVGVLGSFRYRFHIFGLGIRGSQKLQNPAPSALAILHG